MKQSVKLIFLILVLGALAGCSSFGRTMKSLVGGDPEPEQTAVGTSSTNSNVPANLTYSQQDNLPVQSDRQYKRVTKEEYENENLSKEREGSLWVMEGQESYLFSQNIVRLPGDILNVQLDGQPQKQLSTKVGVIRDLVNGSMKTRRDPASLNGNVNSDTAAGNSVQGKASGESAQVSEKTGEKVVDQKDIPFDVSQIPVRVVDRNMDGSYRVKGSQIFMIGKDEYKVIVSGLVRPGDVADGAISASKIVDSKFDIVRSKKRGL